MTIKEASKQSGLTPDTLRYYEKIGLLRHIKRNAHGERDYGEEDLKVISFVRCMRSAGVSLLDLSTYLGYLRQGESKLRERREILIKTRGELLEKQEQLNATIARLEAKIAKCDEELRK